VEEGAGVPDEPPDEVPTPWSATLADSQTRPYHGECCFDFGAAATPGVWGCSGSPSMTV
jgi:hypothetical protein